MNTPVKNEESRQDPATDRPGTAGADLMPSPYPFVAGDPDD
jgi:hypothetical protein